MESFLVALNIVVGMVLIIPAILKIGLASFYYESLWRPQWMSQTLMVVLVQSMLAVELTVGLIFLTNVSLGSELMFFLIGWGSILTIYGIFSIRSSGSCGCSPMRTPDNSSTRHLIIRNFALFGLASWITKNDGRNGLHYAYMVAMFSVILFVIIVFNWFRTYRLRQRIIA